MGEQGGEIRGPAHLFLRTLLAAKVPLTEVLIQAARQGMTTSDRIHFAAEVIQSLSGHLDRLAIPVGWELLSRLLVLGSQEDEEGPLQVPLHHSEEVFEHLAWVSGWGLAGGDQASDAFRHRVLKRLGYPASIQTDPTPELSTNLDVLPWLEAGRSLPCGIDLRGYQSAAPCWHFTPQAPILLRDGIGPRVLERRLDLFLWDQAYPRGRWNGPVRLFRIQGLREIRGLSPHSALVVVDCPDLTTLHTTTAVLLLSGCPSLAQLPPLLSGESLHIERCPQLRSLTPPEPPDFTSYNTVTLSDCPRLHQLPDRMRVRGDLILDRMGSIQVWPSQLEVGGDLILRNCSGLDELPPVEVRGSIRILGESSLRALAPGTLVGRHLDLRACHRLRGIPRGVRVSGNLLLPSHIQRVPVPLQQAPLLPSETRDFYDDLRQILLQLRFTDLREAKNPWQDLATAEEVLDRLRTGLENHPRLESELLWTASEAWTELMEARWEQRSTLSSPHYGDDTFPIAWFRNLLLHPKAVRQP